MIELRTPAEIEAMRPAGRFVAEMLATLRDETKVGTNLLAIDRRAHELIRRAGAESCYIDYHPSFGARPVRQGHLHVRQRRRAARAPATTTRCRTATSSRWTSPCRSTGGSPTRPSRSSSAPPATRISRSSTRPNGRWMPRSAPQSWEPDRRHLARDRGGRPRGRLRDQHRLRRTRRRSDHARRPARAERRQGRVAAIRCARASSSRSSRGSCETTDELVTDPDGWTLRSADGSRGAHSEHTVAITEDGPIVLTDRSWLGVG